MSKNIEDEILWLIIANVHLFCLHRETFSNDNVDEAFRNTSQEAKNDYIEFFKQHGAFQTFEQLTSITLSGG
jgi:D-alanyl-lipoteichoic acid acyltransferase DltB (MBOAT superfamily)